MCDNAEEPKTASRAIHVSASCGIGGVWWSSRGGGERHVEDALDSAKRKETRPGRIQDVSHFPKSKFPGVGNFRATKNKTVQRPSIPEVQRISAQP